MRRVGQAEYGVSSSSSLLTALRFPLRFGLVWGLPGCRSLPHFAAFRHFRDWGYLHNTSHNKSLWPLLGIFYGTEGYRFESCRACSLPLTRPATYGWPCFFGENGLGVYRLAWACRCAAPFRPHRTDHELRHRPIPLDVAGPTNALPDFSSGQGDSATRTAKEAQGDRKFGSSG